MAFLLGFAAPVLAQQSTPPAAPAPAPAQKAPAKAALKPAAKPKPAIGTVKSASADSLVLVAGKDKKEWTFGIDKDTKITKAGKAATAADLAADDAATVTYTEADGKMHAKSVSVKAKVAAAKPKS
ncbi:MAG: hypothetical protein HY359_14175 [Candidatus Rokubacteria bacterium]|nr:hypothetical protein [Candidatus Rokubacteria bacterium]